MIKDLKHRLGFGDYQLRNLPAIHRQIVFINIFEAYQDRFSFGVDYSPEASAHNR
jgi:hypothetical protein